MSHSCTSKLVFGKHALEECQPDGLDWCHSTLTHLNHPQVLAIPQLHDSRVWVADADTDMWKPLKKTTKQRQKCFPLLHIMPLGALKLYHNPRPQ